jgi:hypothetical protein
MLILYIVIVPRTESDAARALLKGVGARFPGMDLAPLPPVVEADAVKLLIGVEAVSLVRVARATSVAGVLCVSLVSAVASAQSSEGELGIEPRDPAASRTVEVSKTVTAPAPRAFLFRAGSGVGVFQDVQVPVNEEANLRSDGKLIEEESANHFGFPVWAGIGYAARRGNLSADLLSFEALQMRATTGPAATQSASYTRVALGSSVRWSFPLFSGKGSAGMRAGLRRSGFNNVSSAHYAESLLVGGGFGFIGSGWSTDLSGSISPVSRFGYSEDNFLGGQAFKKSKSTVSDVAWTTSFLVYPRVWLETGIEREAVAATIDDVSEYDAFGLTVGATAAPTRSLSLSTTMARLGIRKEF